MKKKPKTKTRTNTPSKTRAAPVRTPKAWTVALYMVADGPSGSAALDTAALNEIELIKKTAGQITSDVNVAIQVDLKTRNKWRRLIVGRDVTLGPEENAASPATLDGFFEFVQSECPAERYLVQLWGHSAGPVGLFQDESCRTCRPETLDLHELRTVFEHTADVFGHPVDIVLFKDCWMANLEMLGQLNGLAEFAIASQGLVVPRFGWPYAEMLQCLDQRETGQVARALIGELSGFYALAKNRQDKVEDLKPADIVEVLKSGKVGDDDRMDEIPFAAFSLREMKSVEGELKNLVARLQDVQQLPETRQAFARASRGDPGLLDVILLCRNLSAQPGAGRALKPQAIKLIKALNRLCVASAPAPSGFTGVSAFYFPLASEDLVYSFIAEPMSPEQYRRLQLSASTGWDAIALSNRNR